MTAKILYPYFESAPRNARLAPGGAGSALREEGVLASLFDSYIAAEHRCVMPDGHKRWYALDSVDDARTGSEYVCAECGAPWSRRHG